MVSTASQDMRQLVTLFLSICDTKPHLPIASKESLLAVLNRSENFYGYESKGLICSLDK